MSVIAGQEAIHSDHGESIEVCRKDVVEFCLELRQAGMRLAPAKIGSNAAQRRGQPISDGIRLAIKDLWPGGVPTGLRAIERDNQILAWLKDKEKSTTDSISRAVQKWLIYSIPNRDRVNRDPYRPAESSDVGSSPDGYNRPSVDPVQLRLDSR